MSSFKLSCGGLRGKAHKFSLNSGAKGQAADFDSALLMELYREAGCGLVRCESSVLAVRFKGWLVVDLIKIRKKDYFIFKS